ncbi:type II toxin-antitoxin system ParD family antitoxin [Acuticoccus sediminis]|uniref:Type II toxin-antitoxin system ParD family antitoxin n=1 Tax=Acuticoccus sediminis TaxID=2184697 RepID=A0A8B2NLB6_9HYPH|nr:type II toxin-antitoxin system ParD family antitoxin [Acuticoccus sediminis]RAH97245.1 type II toxin-antitoxin system ParD family antitoxin [Acuticoccus sediminis]
MTVKSSISLSDEQHAFARALVSSGRYSSVSAVLAQGLELLKARSEAETLETEALRLLLEERRRGPFVSAGEMGDRLTAMVERKRRDAGLQG